MNGQTSADTLVMLCLSVTNGKSTSIAPLGGPRSMNCWLRQPDFLLQECQERETREGAESAIFSERIIEMVLKPY